VNAASIMVGVDPGVTTGLAEWDRHGRRLAAVGSMLLHEAWARVLELRDAGQLHSVTFEDARLRTGYFGERSAAKLQGAGSVKRDCSAWADFLGAHGIPYRSISPRAKGAKLDAEPFARITGWRGRTNEHGRDAAMLVFGR
jgi:hypothetical protein